MNFGRFVENRRRPTEVRSGAEMYRALKYTLANPNARKIREIARDVWVYYDMRSRKLKYFTSYNLAKLADMLNRKNALDGEAPKVWMWWACHEEATDIMVAIYKKVSKDENERDRLKEQIPRGHGYEYLSEEETQARETLKELSESQAGKEQDSYTDPKSWDDIELPF